MKRTIPFYLFALLPATFAITHAVYAQSPAASPDEEFLHRDATASALVTLIFSKLPGQDGFAPAIGLVKGNWDVFYQPQYSLIVVQRDKAVLIPHEPMINDSPVAHTPTLGRPGFSLSVEPFISPVEYAQLKSENATINEQLSQMAVGMKDIRHKFDSYLPKNQEEKQKVGAYNKLKSSLHHLPDFYFRDISLSWWVLGPGVNPYSRQPGEIPLAFKPNAQQKGWERERATAVQGMLSFLSRYEPEPK